MPLSNVVRTSHRFFLNLSNERHSKWPPKLRGLDIFSDPSLFLSWKRLQPFPYRLVARLCSIENNVENMMDISHGTPIVPNMVRLSTLLFDEKNHMEISLSYALNVQ